MKKEHVGLISLFIVSLIWGFAFIAVEYALDNGWNTFTILAVRGILSGLLMYPFALKSGIFKDKKVLIHSIIAGIFFFIGYTLQTLGQLESDVSNTAFYTCLYVIFTPFIAIFFGKKEVGVKTFVAAFLALLGIYFSAFLANGNTFRFYLGDILVIICGVFFALQIIWAGHYLNGKYNAISISSVMLLTMGLLSSVMIFITGETMPTSFKGFEGVFFAAIFSSGVCSILQLYGQKSVDSSTASIILSLETPIAFILAILMLGEEVNIFMIIGLVLMILGVVVAQVKFKKKKDFSKYEYLLIDVDDTLLDFKKAEHEAFKMLLSEFNIYYTDELYKIYHDENNRLWREFELGNISKDDIFNLRMIPLFKHLNIDSDPKEASYRFLNYLSMGAYLIDDTYNELERLSKKYKLYIISNGVAKVQYPRLESVDIMKFFSGIYISEEVGYNKPSKEFFEFIASDIENFDKSKALVIGDSLSSDMTGAINFGIDSCWFNPNGLESALKITYTISNLKEIG